MIGSGDCDLHRPTLEAFAERREIGRATNAALVHLDGCRRCTFEVEQIALAITALERLAEEATRATAERLSGASAYPAHGSTGWARLRARVDRKRVPAWRWRTQLGGVVLGAAIVAAAIGPSSIPRAGATVLDEAGVDRSAVVDPARRDSLAEAAWFKESARTEKERLSETPIQAATPIAASHPNPAVFGTEARPVPSVPTPPPAQVAR